MENGTFVKSPAFQIYPADFLADKNTLVMSAAEVGAYWLLLCVCWRENGLADDLEELAAIARTPLKQFQKSWEKRIQRCFILRDDGKWTHNRLEKERVKQFDWKQKSSEGGKASANQRAKNRLRVVEPNGNGDGGTVVEPIANSSSSISSSSSTSSSEQIQQRAKRTPVLQGTRLPDDFCLNSEMREWATREAPHVDVDRAFAAFGDYWRGVPGAKGKKLDWLATWRNRLRDLEEHRTRSNGATNVDNSLAAARRVAAKYEHQQS